MNCPTCGCCAIENMANNKKFYFCEECREEVPEQGMDFDDLSPEEMQEFNDYLDSLEEDEDFDYDYGF